MKRKKKIKQRSNQTKSSRIPVDFSELSEKSQRSWDIPEFYEDINFECVECGKKEIFTAQEQQEWYEVKKKYFWQRPIRCSLHQDIWRETRRRKFKMDRSLLELKDDPNNLESMKQCAEAITLYHQSTKNGNLELAISLFKKLKLQNKLYDYCKKEIEIP